jgi:hypothetical protein
MAGPTTEGAGTVDRAALKSELEDVRVRYHALLASVSDAEWKRKSGNPAWTCGQLLYHLAWAAGFSPSEVENTKKGKGWNPPEFIANPMNVMLTRFGARRAKRDALGRKFDDAIAKMTAAVDAVGDDEWGKTARSFGRDLTVEKVFHEVGAHLAEHEADIRKGLAS